MRFFFFFFIVPTSETNATRSSDSTRASNNTIIIRNIHEVNQIQCTYTNIIYDKIVGSIINEAKRYLL